MGFTIAFNTNGGDIRQDVTAGNDTWTEVEEPSYPGHVFAGWVATGHAKATAVYSTDGGTTGVKMEADPMPVAVDQDGRVEVKNLRTDDGTVMLTAQWKTVIGGANTGCPTIELPPFTPICSKGAVARSTPLSLEVPAPVFAPAIPPPECACFSFTAGTADIKVTMHEGRSAGTGTAKVAITSTGDCCEGTYEVTPTITFEIPECAMEDFEEEKTIQLGYGGWIKYKFGVKDCKPYFKTEEQKLDVTIPGYVGPCFANSTFNVKTSYTLGTDTTPHVSTPQTITVTAGRKGGDGDDANCVTFTPGDITIDMSDFAFGNGGNVYRGDDGNLYTDGALTEGAKMWYGGGAGDRDDDTHASQVFSRGPLMRGLSGNQVGPAGSGDHEIPHRENVSYRITTQTAQGETVPQSTQKWRSSNADDENPDGAETGWETGNLNMSLPSGFQWDKRGIAVNLSTFQWNEAGLLNSMVEPGYAAIVAPGLAAYKDNATRNSQNVGGKDISGLAVMMAPSDNRHEPGLVVNDGLGLRVFGADAKTADSEITSGTVNEIGELDIFAHDGDFAFNYDEKMVINDEKTASFYQVPWIDTTAKFARDSDYALTVGLNTLEPDDLWELYNDHGNVGFYVPNLDVTYAGNLSAIANYTDANAFTAANLKYLATALYDVMRWISSWHIATVHLGKAGTVLAVNNTIAQDVQIPVADRHYQANAPSQNG